VGNNSALHIFIGHDSREAVATEVAAYSIRKRTKSPTDIKFLKHRELRRAGLFKRPWLIDSETGEFKDLIDNRPFSTEFSHTRFLVPALMQYKGWALFCDADMLFQVDVMEIFRHARNKYAVMVVKHNQVVKENKEKMDGRLQQNYFRKNWSSFILWNCEHPANKKLSKEFVNMAQGSELHSFSWLKEHEIGALPNTYNYISGVSPVLPVENMGRPDVVHYTEGGPWFKDYRNCPYGDLWLEEYEDFQLHREDYFISEMPTIIYEKGEL